MPNTALSGHHWFGGLCQIVGEIWWDVNRAIGIPKWNVLDVDDSIAEDSLVQAIFHRPPDAGTCLARATWLPRVPSRCSHSSLRGVCQTRQINIESTILFVMNRSVNFLAVDLWSRKFDILKPLCRLDLLCVSMMLLKACQPGCPLKQPATDCLRID